MRKEFFSSSQEETQRIGRTLAAHLPLGSLLCLTGDLGAGKTTLLKGLISALTDTPVEEVVSPTFGYLHIYQGSFPLYHFDLYRLQDPKEFIEAGFLDFLGEQGFFCIEWPDRLPSSLSNKKITLHIHYLTEETRLIQVEGLCLP